MKQGSTFILLVSLDVDISYVDSIIFTIKNGNKVLTKTDYLYDAEKKQFQLFLTQEDTIEMQGRCLVEAQINFTDLHVAKSEIATFIMNPTLATKIVTGNQATTDGEEVALEVDGEIVYVGGSSGTSDYMYLKNKPQINGVELIENKSAKELGIDVPTKTSQLENDSGFAYQSTVDAHMESFNERLWFLDRDVLRVSEVANEANTVAKGASRPLVYDNYEMMVNAINGAVIDDIDELRIGWNILIKTLNVPDLWVSGISEEQVYYEYVSDEQFVSELLYGSVQVGYYLLSPLETQKVNLTEYPTQEDLDDVYTNLREEDFALGVQIENLENHVNDMFAEYVTEVAELIGGDA